MLYDHYTHPQTPFRTFLSLLPVMWRKRDNWANPLFIVQGCPSRYVMPLIENTCVCVCVCVYRTTNLWLAMLDMFFSCIYVYFHPFPSEAPKNCFIFTLRLTKDWNLKASNDPSLTQWWPDGGRRPPICLVWLGDSRYTPATAFLSTRIKILSIVSRSFSLTLVRRERTTVDFSLRWWRGCWMPFYCLPFSLFMPVYVNLIYCIHITSLLLLYHGYISMHISQLNPFSIWNSGSSHKE